MLPPPPPPPELVTALAGATVAVTVTVAVLVGVTVIVMVTVAVGDLVTVTDGVAVGVIVAVPVGVTVGVTVTVRVVVTVGVCVTVGVWVRVGVTDGVRVVVGELGAGVGVQAHAIWARLRAPGMLSRPAPYAFVFWVAAAVTRTEERSAVRTCSRVSDGKVDKIRAAAPATWGDAIDVPLIEVYVDERYVLMMEEPGAEIPLVATYVCCVEYEATVFVLSTAATGISLPSPLLPASAYAAG